MSKETGKTIGSLPFQIDEFYLDLQADGSKVRILSDEEISSTPFPGLRPFKTSEFQLFNGRTGQAEELVRRLSNKPFLAVIGSSGTGKSSLVRAGLIPQLLGGYLHTAGTKWDVAICRPGKDPVENLAVALASIKSRTTGKESLQENFDAIEPLVSSSAYGLLEAKELLDNSATQEQEAGSKSNLLVIVDQFEELFRFDRSDLDKPNIEKQFVNLLLKASLDPTNSIYVIITMRSEFLGDCVKYRGLPEAINEGQYLVPQLTRNELKEVIENPIRLAGKKISPKLVELLVNEIEESKMKEVMDQLPIMQHALMRTYNEAMSHGEDTVIDYDHYKAIGEMTHALANHAETKFRELGDPGSAALSQKQNIAKIVFQSLTQLSSDQKGGRRPTDLKNIYAIAASKDVGEAAVDEVVNHFRGSDTSFIMPPINTELNPGVILDISHESLMRNWSRLNEWLAEEMKFGALYRQLNERRQLHEKDSEEWLRGMLLRELLVWKDSYANNVTWASRYHLLPGKSKDPGIHKNLYQKNLDFLQRSAHVNSMLREQEQKELKEKIEREQREQNNKQRNRIFVLATVISLLFAVLAFTQSRQATKNYRNAKEQEKLAKGYADAARDSAASARKERQIALLKSDQAEIEKKNAEEQTKIAQEKTKLASAQALLLKEYADKAGYQAQVALRLKDSAVQKNEDFEKQLVKNALKNEPFYFSRSLDQATKEALIDSLFITPSFNARQIELGKYIDLDVLQSINKAVRAKEYAVENRQASLDMARNIWRTNQNPVLKNLVLSVVNDNIFPRQTLSLNDINAVNNVNIAVDGNGNDFAISTGKQIISGKGNGDQLSLNESSFDNSFLRFYCSMQDSLRQTKKLDWIGLAGGNAMVLANDFKLTLDKTGMIASAHKIPGTANHVYAQTSPDGNKVVLMDVDGNLTLKDLTPGRSRDTLLGNFRDELNGNENIIFSPDSKLLFLNVTGKPRLLNSNGKPLGMTDWENEDFVMLGFMADSKHIIVLSDDVLRVRDSTLGNIFGEFKKIDLKEEPFNRSNLVPKKVNYISVSANGKKLMLAQKDGRAFLVETTTNTPVFSNLDSGNTQLRIKEISNGKYRYKPAFFGDSAIISINDGGELALWPLYPPQDNPEQLFNTPGLWPTVTDSLRSDQLSAKQVLLRDDFVALNNAADYYNTVKKIDSAKLFYQKLVERSPEKMKLYYAEKLIALNTELINMQRISGSYNPSKTPEDKVIDFRSEKVSRLEEIVALQKQQLALCPDDKTIKQNLSTTYGSMSFNQLFQKDFDGSIASAKAGLALSPVENDWIYTNLALANLLSGNYKEAEKIYTDWKDKTFTDKRMTFKAAFLADFNDMKNAGVLKSMSSSVSKNIEKIKSMLEQPTAPAQEAGRKK